VRILETLTKDLILSMIIGDGFVKKTGALELCHGAKQLDFLVWKKELVEKSLGKKPNKVCSRVKTVKGKQYINYSTTLVGPKIIANLRSDYYTGSGKNYLNILKNVTDSKLLVAMWAMDDGQIGYRRTNGVVNSAHLDFCSYDQSHETHLELKKWFLEKFNVNANIKFRNDIKKYFLSFNQADSMVLYFFIREYTKQIPSMQHKFRFLEEKFLRSFNNLSTSPRLPAKEE